MKKKKENNESPATEQVTDIPPVVEVKDPEIQPTIQDDNSSIKVDTKAENTEEPVKQIKNICIGQCIKTIIASLVFLVLVGLVPITFGTQGLSVTFKALPIFGDGSISVAHEGAATGFSALLNNDSITIITTLLNVATIAFFVILILNILCALFLIISRIQVCRKIFKIYTIFAGVVMIFIFAMNIIHILGIAGLIIKGIIPTDFIMTALETSAILTAIAMAIFSGILMFKQFKWFEKLY